MGLVVLESGPGFTMRPGFTRGTDGVPACGRGRVKRGPLLSQGLTPQGLGPGGRDRVARGPWGLKQPLFNHWWGTVSIF